MLQPLTAEELCATGGVNGVTVAEGIGLAATGAALVLAPEVTIPVMICGFIADAAGGYIAGAGLAQ